MRIFAWAGGIAAAVLISVSALSELGSRSTNSPPVAVAQLQTIAAGSGLPMPTGLFPATPSPTPAASKAKPPRTAFAPKPPTARTTTTTSRPSIVVRSTQQSLINQDRARYRLAPLTWSTCLYNVARYEASHLAAPGVNFQHYDGVSRDLACHLGRQAGENIGWHSGGINDATLNTMFMNSPDHRANILGPYRFVATAWAVRSDGRAYIAVEFG